MTSGTVMYWSGLLIVVFGDLAPVNIEISSYGENFRAVHIQYLSPIMLFWKKAQQYTLFLFLLLQIKTLKEIFVTLNLQNFLLKIISVYSIINLLWELASFDEMSCWNGQCYVTFMDNFMYITLVCSLKYWTTMTLVYTG